MDPELSISSFSLLDTIEKRFFGELESNKDLQHGTLKTHRVLNLFKSTVALFIHWEQEAGEAKKEETQGETQPEDAGERKAEEPQAKEKAGNSELGTLSIQEIPENKDALLVFKVKIKMNAHTTELISLFNNAQSFERESSRLFLYFKAYLQKAIKDKLPDVSFEKEPDALLEEANTIESQVMQHSKTSETKEEKEPEPAKANS